MQVKCNDGTLFSDTKGEKETLLGSVVKMNSRDIHKPPIVGEFPVCLEQFSNYKLFTYRKRIIEVIP
jgi:hypothetical protein